MTHITHVIENGIHYAIRNGRRIEIVTMPDDLPVKPRRKPFKVKFVQMPLWWVKTLEQAKYPSTYRLAFAILAEAFKRKYLGGPVKLSSTVTGMPRTTRRKAARELQKLGLIRIEHQSEGKAPTVYVIESLLREDKNKE